MEGFVDKMGEIDIRGCISQHMTCIEMDRDFGVGEKSIGFLSLSFS
jgi:hypothetical protein